MASLRELLVSLGQIRIVEPVVDLAYANVAQRNFQNSNGDDPHGRAWHLSFHASQFPGDVKNPCPRLAMYQMMDVPLQTPIDRWLDGVAEVGKAIELQQVRKVRDDGRLVRSARWPDESTDPDAIDENRRPMPQIGFVDVDCWLTGSVDMPMMPYGAQESVHIVEVKTKHEVQVGEMMQGVRAADASHRRQLLCSLGLAHEFGEGVFLHPTEDRVLPPPDDGSIYYLSRDDPWPGPKRTFEFYFEYDADFMEAGRRHLRQWRQHFLDDELPQEVDYKTSRSHPFGWKWSEGTCKYCAAKKICREDYAAGVTKISESRSAIYAGFVRPGYDPGAKRDAVLFFWEKMANGQT